MRLFGVSRQTRRAPLATLAGVALSGCTNITDRGPPSEYELPNECPTSLNLDVNWPRELDADAVYDSGTRLQPHVQRRNRT